MTSRPPPASRSPTSRAAVPRQCGPTRPAARRVDAQTSLPDHENIRHEKHSRRSDVAAAGPSAAGRATATVKEGLAGQRHLAHMAAQRHLRYASGSHARDPRPVKGRPSTRPVKGRPSTRHLENTCLHPRPGPVTCPRCPRRLGHVAPPGSRRNWRDWRQACYRDP